MKIYSPSSLLNNPHNSYFLPIKVRVLQNEQNQKIDSKRHEKFYLLSYKIYNYLHNKPEKNTFSCKRKVIYKIHKSLLFSKIRSLPAVPKILTT